MARLIKSLDKQIEKLKERKRNEQEKQHNQAVELAKKMFLSAKWVLNYDGSGLQLYVKNKELAKLLRKVAGNIHDSEIVFSREFSGVEPFHLFHDCWLDHDFNQCTGESKPNDGIECSLSADTCLQQSAVVEILAKHLPNMQVDQNALKYTETEMKAISRMNRIFLDRIIIKYK